MLFSNVTHKSLNRELLFYLIIIFLASNISLFAQAKPSFNLSQGPTLLANGAPDESVGAKYIYQNVAVSADGLIVDAILTIVAKVNVQEFNAGSFTVDTVIGLDDRFEPTINTGLGVGYVEWQIEFVLDNTVVTATDEGIRARLESFTMEAIDVDGFEFFDAVVTGSYTLEGGSPPTDLSVFQVGDFTRFQSDADFAAGIDTNDTEFIVRINFTNISIIKFRNGSSNDSNNRQNSVSFLGEITFNSENTVVVNQPPVVIDNLGNQINSNSSFSKDVLVGSSDPDGNLDISKVRLTDPNDPSNQGKVNSPLIIPSVGTYLVSSSGIVSFIPLDEFTGDASVLFSVEDDLGVSSDQKNLEITVVDRCNAAVSGNIDSDGDNVSDICDLDDDNDGILDSDELVCEDTTPVNNEILVASSGGRIYTTNTLTGGSTLLTTSPFTGGLINALAANPDNDLLYYGVGTNIYFYNLLTDTHALLADLSTFPEFSGGSLESGGASYLDGVYYIGSEQTGDLSDVFAVQLSTDGKSVLNVEDLNVYDAALADGFDFQNDPPGGAGANGFGDITALYEGADIIIYGSTAHNNPTRPSAFWSFNTTTKDWQLITTTHSWPGGQTAADSNGNLYVNQGQSIVQIDKTNGNIIGGLVTVGVFITDFTGPAIETQCNPRQDTDGDGIPDYLDSDSDGDGCSDADEAYYGSINNADADNNGFYGSGAPTVDAQGRVVGASYNVTNTFHLNGNINTCDDADMDGIPDFVDVDDDNDGILDTEEDSCSTATAGSIDWDQDFSTIFTGERSNFQNDLPATSATLDGTTLTVSYTDPVGGLENIEVTDGFGFGQRVLQIRNANNTPGGVITTFEFSNPVNDLTFSIQDIDSDANIGDGFDDLVEIKAYRLNGSIVQITASNYGGTLGNHIKFNGNNKFQGVGREGNAINGDTGGVLNLTFPELIAKVEITFSNLVSLPNNNQRIGITDLSYDEVCDVDVDNDGIPNRLDTDSDNDGCPDAIEGAGNFQTSNLANPGTDDSLGDSVETNASSPNYGVPIISGASTQQATTAAVLDDTNKDACLVDLNLIKTIDKPIKKVGDNIVFTITLKNEGDADATNVMVKDILPAGLTYDASTSVVPTNTTYTQATGIWDLSLLTIKKGETKILQIGATVTTAGTIITNKTEVFSATEDDKDSTKNNNN
ncbi:DUF11 domain-containing protein [Polaribacter batillariae]|uniref:DUF11 domain-containing protein n=1 Tax=Polaribacter batillariae TaxID=2808900 RepID=A0ABX7SZG9_9FLAO|nr:DUF11 domain-containing protein [Polaribacter batillariae]QTD39094.1 DUF11 domain-containing protein [Polaribacter batillariae]